MSPHFGHFYLVVLNSISVGIAMFTLASFYLAVRENIRTYNPLLQFFSVKFVIFFGFWQSVALKLLGHFHLLPTQSPVSAHLLSISLSTFLTCVEMALAAIIHLWAFDYGPFVSVTLGEEVEGEAEGGREGVWEALRDTFSFLDVWDDVRAVGAFFGWCGVRIRRHSAGWRRWSSVRVGEAPEERRALVRDDQEDEEFGG